MRAAPPLPFAVACSRAIAVASTLGLIALGLAWELWLAPTGRGTLALKVLPLAFAVSGLLKCRMPTYRWLSLLLWLYFAEGALRASTELGASALLASVEAALSLALFGACVMHIRSRLRRAKAATP